MKIAFLSILSPYEVNNWSGTLYYIFHSLQKTHDVKWVGDNIVEKVKKNIIYNIKKFLLFLNYMHLISQT